MPDDPVRPALSQQPGVGAGLDLAPGPDRPLRDVWLAGSDAGHHAGV
ncbi:hypothetical protein [Microbacterium yannicii]|nr:hypothetical protein [Microbacterium yannicii]